MAGDALELKAPAGGPAVRVRFVAGDKVFDREAVMAGWQPVAGARPVVFLNYRETLLETDCDRNFRAIGAAPGGLSPGTPDFSVVSAHANGNAAQALETGVRFVNSGSKPITVRVDAIEVSKGSRAPGPGADKGVVIEVPPGKSVDLPVARAMAHPRNGNPRDGSRPVVFRLDARVVAGDPVHLAIHDVARFPGARAAGPTSPAGSARSGDAPLHHEGVFLPQKQVTAPPVLDPGNAAYVRIRGSNQDHDAHYYALHTAFVAIPDDRQPRFVVFAGPGGMLRPEVGGKRLPAIGNVIDRARPETLLGTERFRNLSRNLEHAVPFAEAVRQGLLKRTGERDSRGNPIYRIDVRFLAGDNGDLLIYGNW